MPKKSVWVKVFGALFFLSLLAIIVYLSYVSTLSEVFITNQGILLNISKTLPMSQESSLFAFLQSLVLFDTILFGFYVIVVVEVSKELSKLTDAFTIIPKAITWVYVGIFLLIAGLSLINGVFNSLSAIAAYANLTLSAKNTGNVTLIVTQVLQQNSTRGLNYTEVGRYLRGGITATFLGGLLVFGLLLVYILFVSGLVKYAYGIYSKYQEQTLYLLYPFLIAFFVIAHGDPYFIGFLTILFVMYTWLLWHTGKFQEWRKKFQEYE